MITREEYERMRSLSLDDKVTLTMDKIIDFYEYYNGKVYISFSGGKDSTVLVHIAKSIYPDIPIVFANTGLEFPEIVEFAKSISDVIVRPKRNFSEVIKTEGYPIISKSIARKLRDLQHPTNKNINIRRLYLEGIRSDGKKGSMYSILPKKWKYLINAPFKISERCCDIIKKQPLLKYERETGRKPIIGTLATDSLQREIIYLQYGCNSFKHGKSRPLSFWTTEDIWNYIKQNNIPYCKIYNMGYHNTGCIYCMFGVHLDKEPNRFQQMKITHPKLYDYCINRLNLKQCLDYIGVKY